MSEPKDGGRRSFRIRKDFSHRRENRSGGSRFRAGPARRFAGQVGLWTEGTTHCLTASMKN